MRSFLDFEEKSVEKAVQQACNELNVSAEKLKYDIISHGSSGIFGLVGAKKALIRVFVPDTSNKHAKSDMADKGTGRKKLKPNNTEQSNKETVNALVDEAFGEVKESVPEESVPEESVPEESVPEESVPEEAETVNRADVTINETAVVTVAQELAQKIFNTLSIDADMTISKDADQCWIKVKGSDPGILIGKRGQTLEAIQYLIDKVVNKQCGKGNRIIIDVEGYVESRKAELKDLASRLAKKTSKTGKPSTMSRMNAHDRRVVHVALKGNRLVRTQSVGEGYYRKLIIFPKKKRNKRQSQEK